jgi:hypothetical protein
MLQTRWNGLPPICTIKEIDDMRKFSRTYDLSNLNECKTLLGVLNETHLAIQKLEAGTKLNKPQMAFASYKFLVSLGYFKFYPTVDNREVQICSSSLLTDFKNFWVKMLTSEGIEITAPLFSPKSKPSCVIMDYETIKNLVKLAFPALTILESYSWSKDNKCIYHVSVRTQYTQGEAYGGEPLPSGSAACSNQTVALMQAMIRMIHNKVTAIYAAGLSSANAVYIQTEKRNRLATMYGTGRRLTVLPDNPTDLQALAWMRFQNLKSFG